MDNPDPEIIEWKVHLSSPPPKVYRFISSETGREQFWAESAVENDGVIHFVFPNGVEFQSEIREASPHDQFILEYFGGTATFELNPTVDGGTDLTLHHESLDQADFQDTNAGWVSVLLSLKAAVDHGIDLRNHDPNRTWDEGFADN